jgi:hypothetical protein
MHYMGGLSAGRGLAVPVGMVGTFLSGKSSRDTGRDLVLLLGRPLNPRGVNINVIVVNTDDEVINIGVDRGPWTRQS